MSRFSYSSGADELIKGYQLGSAISGSMKKDKMDKETADALNREQTPEFTQEKLKGLETNYAQTGDAGVMGVDGKITYGAGETAAPGARLGDSYSDTPRSAEEVKGLNRKAARDVLGKYGDEGAKRIAQMDSEDAAAEGLKSAKRSNKKGDAEDTMDTNVSKLMDYRSTLAPDSPEYKDTTAKIGSAVSTGKGALQAEEYMAKQEKLAVERRDLGEKEQSKALFKAADSEEAALKYFNDQFKDDAKYYAHRNPDGSTSIVQEDGKGGVGTVMQYKDWKEARNQIIAKIPEAARVSWELGVKNDYTVATAKTLAEQQSTEKGLDRASAEKIAGMRVAAQTANAAKYGVAKDSLGNMYAKGTDGQYRSDSGDVFDPAVGGQLFLLGTQAQPKAADVVKASTAFDDWAAAKSNRMPMLAQSWLKSDASDKKEYTEKMAEWLPRANEQRAVLGLPPLAASGGGLSTGKVAAPAKEASVPAGAIQVKSIEEARALKPGTRFVDPNGIPRTR